GLPKSAAASICPHHSDQSAQFVLPPAGREIDRQTGTADRMTWSRPVHSIIRSYRILAVEPFEPRSVLCARGGPCPHRSVSLTVGGRSRGHGMNGLLDQMAPSLANVHIRSRVPSTKDPET